MATKTLTMELADWPEARHGLSGTATVLLRVLEVGGRSGEVRALARGPLVDALLEQAKDVETPEGLRAAIEGGG